MPIQIHLSLFEHSVTQMILLCGVMKVSFLCTVRNYGFRFLKVAKPKQFKAFDPIIKPWNSAGAWRLFLDMDNEIPPCSAIRIM